MNEAGANEELFSIIIVSQLFNTNKSQPISEGDNALKSLSINLLLELPEIGLIC